MTNSYAMLAHNCPDEDFPLLRELLAYDMQCPISCTFARGQYGDLLFAYAPSPFHWSRQSEWPWVLREGDFQPGHSVLDIGSGWSVLKYPIADRISVGRKCGTLIALDINEEFIRKAQSSIDLLCEHNNITQKQGDAADLPFPDSSFDRVVSVSVLEHIPGKHMDCIKEAIRVLRPGGIALFTMDVVLEGEAGAENNFYLTKQGCEEIIAMLGISEIRKKEDAGVIGAHLKDEGVGIVCVMIKYVKPKE